MSITPDERTELFDDLERRYRGSSSQINYGSQNGNGKYITSLLTIMSALITAAILGGVVMYGKIQELETKMDLIIGGHIRIGDGRNP